MRPFDEKYDEIMKMPVDKISTKIINEFIDLADTRSDFRKIEKIHLLLIMHKTKDMDVQSKSTKIFSK